MQTQETEIKNTTLAPPVRGWKWGTIAFFGSVHLIALIGIPLYLLHHSISLATWLLLGFYLVATGLSITVGYHRFLAHQTFRSGNLVRFLVLFFGAAAFEMSALAWSSQHRDHHRYVDTDLDPYNIKKGFFYAHMGWMLFWEHQENFSNAKDLQKSRLVMNQHKYYGLWAAFAGIVLPVLIGALTGHALAAFLIAVCGRIVMVYQTTFCINSVCHTFGKTTYDIHGSARDNWFTALFTWGEGYHNFHHRFPSDYRNGVQWYQWDPSKWVIRLLHSLGFVTEIRRTSPHRILAARIAAQSLRTEIHLDALKRWPGQEAALVLVRSKYADLVALLQQWEEQFKNYALLHGQPAKSQRFVKLLFLRAQKSREQFLTAYKEWKGLVERNLRVPVLPSFLSQAQA